MRNKKLAPTAGSSSGNEATRVRAAGQDDDAVPLALPLSSDPDLTNTELVQLRMRVIALENLMIAVLANASEHQLELAQRMAEYILPRDGATEHPLTIHAAAQMSHLVERARLFQRGAVEEAAAHFRPAI